LGTAALYFADAQPSRLRRLVGIAATIAGGAGRCTRLFGGRRACGASAYASGGHVSSVTVIAAFATAAEPDSSEQFANLMD